MPNNVKDMLDSIINNTDNSYQKNDKGPAFKANTVGATVTSNNFHPQTFDSGKFKEKLSLYVLHDLVDAMMADDTEGLDEMVDKSIMKHINDNYDGSCYGYLCAARDRLKSPILAGVVQEVDDMTAEIDEDLFENKDEAVLDNGEINVKVLLKDVIDYDTFRDKLKDAVSKKVVDDVYGVVTKRNDAPVFDDLDEELEKQDKDKVQEKSVEKQEEEDVTEESVIMRLTGAIVTEHAIANDPITTDEGMDQAIVEYCLHELDMCFKARPKTSFWNSHKF